MFKNRKYGIIVILCLMMVFTSKAQKVPSRHITVHGKDTITEVSVVIKRDIEIKLNKKLDYYWYAFDKIRKNQGEFSGQLLNGKYRMYVGDYMLVESGLFDMGLKTGVWTKWDENGVISQLSKYKNGRKQGACQYFKNGKLYKEEEYNNGLLDGKVTIYKGDNVITEKYNNGNVIIKKDKLKKDVKEKKEGKLWQKLTQKFKRKKEKKTDSNKASNKENIDPKKKKKDKKDKKAKIGNTENL